MSPFCSFIVLIFCFTLNQDVVCFTPSVQEKIVGGYNTTIEDFPYQALVETTYKGTKFQCGGSIVNKNYILTTAHCVYKRSLAKIRIGSTEAIAGGKRYTSSEFLIHPQFSLRPQDYDVGIIKVSEEMELDGVTATAVELPDSNLIIEPGTEILVSGWGRTKKQASLSYTLRAVAVRTISNEECDTYYENKITDRMICSEEGGKNFCLGDTGDPAVRKSDRVQVGIAAFNRQCAGRNSPGVYTSVPSVVDWIRNNTSPSQTQ